MDGFFIFLIIYVVGVILIGIVAFIDGARREGNGNPYDTSEKDMAFLGTLLWPAMLILFPLILIVSGCRLCLVKYFKHRNERSN